MKQRKIAMVSRQIDLKDADQEADDLEYWLSRTPQERLRAVTMLVRQSIPADLKMYRTAFSQRKMK